MGHTRTFYRQVEVIIMDEDATVGEYRELDLSHPWNPGCHYCARTKRYLGATGPDMRKAIDKDHDDMLVTHAVNQTVVLWNLVAGLMWGMLRSDERREEYEDKIKDAGLTFFNPLRDEAEKGANWGSKVMNNYVIEDHEPEGLGDEVYADFSSSQLRGAVEDYLAEQDSERTVTKEDITSWWKKCASDIVFKLPPEEVDRLAEVLLEEVRLTASRVKDEGVLIGTPQPVVMDFSALEERLKKKMEKDALFLLRYGGPMPNLTTAIAMAAGRGCGKSDLEKHYVNILREGYGGAKTGRTTSKELVPSGPGHRAVAPTVEEDVYMYELDPVFHAVKETVMYNVGKGATVQVFSEDGKELLYYIVGYSAEMDAFEVFQYVDASLMFHLPVDDFINGEYVVKIGSEKYIPCFFPYPNATEEGSKNPGEGYRILKLGETTQKGDWYFHVCTWHPSELVQCLSHHNSPYRRKIEEGDTLTMTEEDRYNNRYGSTSPGEGYRLLKLGETIQEGDEYSIGGTKWRTSVAIGHKIVASDAQPYRRKVETVQVTEETPLCLEPGEGYRFLKKGEVIQVDDEWYDDDYETARWGKTTMQGTAYSESPIYRRKVGMTVDLSQWLPVVTTKTPTVTPLESSGPDELVTKVYRLLMHGQFELRLCGMDGQDLGRIVSYVLKDNAFVVVQGTGTLQVSALEAFKEHMVMCLPLSDYLVTIYGEETSENEQYMVHRVSSGEDAKRYLMSRYFKSETMYDRMSAKRVVQDILNPSTPDPN